MDLQQFVRSLNLLFFMLEVFFSVTLSRNIHHIHNRHHHHLSHLNERHKHHFINSNITLGENYQNTSDVGPWGEWGEDSDCSRTCGGGVAFQIRKCLGESSDECIGPSKKYFSCNIQDCPEDSKDFRAEQCSQYDSVKFGGKKFFQWLPYLEAPKKCELNCMPKGERFYYRHAMKVIDGTRCSQENLDICVDGECMPVGCDMMLGSNTKEDKCRECGGDGSSCKTTEGIFDSNDLPIGYNDILLIPSGATNIYIEETDPTNNYIAVRNLTGHYFLNGNWKIDFPRDMHFAGTIFHYERKPHGYQAPETLHALGPTTESIYIVLLYQENNSGIKYEYSVPISNNPVRLDSYSWTYGNFGNCSTTCGGGYETRTVNCARTSNFEVVADYLCDPLLQPSSNRSCNLQPCPPEWHVGEWEECSSSCGGGVQFRIVYCQQITQGNSPTIVNHNICLKSVGPRPIHTQMCNEDIKCPDWHAGPWSLCNKMCGDGIKSRVVTCQKSVNGKIHVYPDISCDIERKPQTKLKCNSGPCEGVDWIVSDWSGCDTCGLLRESRLVHCSNQTGKLFPDDLCDHDRQPDFLRDCPDSPPCDVMWHATEWSECSAKCGTGIQTRKVFCATTNIEDIKKVPDDKCNPLKKYDEIRNCTSKPCKGMWFSGPWNRCTAPCGGGSRTRKILCLLEDDKVVDTSYCDPSERPVYKEFCNQHACDEDEIMVVGGCKDSKYGCCPDNVTKAGPNFKGCPKVVPKEDCETTEFKCCADGITPALGPFRQGCPIVTHCRDTKYKCCPDGITAAKGPNNKGCPPIIGCAYSQFGCCPDGVTPAKGKNHFGCDYVNGQNCNETQFGCCPDGISVASGPGGSGCLDEPEGSGEDCSDSVFGCCPDGITPSQGYSYEGCKEIPVVNIIDEPSKITDCEGTDFGCCRDGIKPATGPKFAGCDDETTPITSDCINALFGCCPDGTTAAQGDNNEGCPATTATTEDCLSSPYGCCLDGKTSAQGFNFEGCETPPPVNCWETEHGCCPDKRTPALGPANEGCPCDTTYFGCCPDGITAARGQNYEGCNCEITPYGCCPDEITEAKGPNMEGCGCHASNFGCCPDGKNAAQGPNYEGCCTDSPFGCCPDQKTLASGPNYEGCPCELSPFGCCPDGVTFAKGPDNEGCPCEYTLYGCCPDGKTSAKGPNDQGCRCDETTFGCCPDQQTTATGPSYEGCPCEITPYGCCPDGQNVAQGLNYEGCPCESSYYGCCSDGKTTAEGPNNEGCPCDQHPFGCCPDGKTPAQGANNEGCGCRESQYGCCPDGRTSAEGPNNLGCSCEGTYYGCCPDQRTTASGPDYEGCPCETSPFGCCPDGLTIARGYNYEGCQCETTPYGCCPDGITAAHGPNEEGCDCETTIYGCCPDGRTPAQGPRQEGCPCETTTYGCCPDRRTPAQGPQQEGCGCETTVHGCCPDGRTPAQGPRQEGCPCETTTYGCCPDRRTPAQGPQQEGCGCETTVHGCCPDGRTPAQGPRQEGCPCETTTYGCCPDGHTPAQGPREEGCPCETTTYGCCPDGRTPAQGPRQEGCDCETTTYGCCPDGRTPAQGPREEGCPCETTTYGCCPDGRTPAQGPRQEGCDCETTTYGCCPDGRTPAQGPQQEGCGCETTVHGCCPDGLTPAQGPRQEGCPCETTSYGCCPDGRTPAQGPRQEGCPCETTTYGCCPDGHTPAQGPQQEGCGCENTTYGCCPDRYTPAQGHNFYGCPCETAPFGCCPDGRTISQGPNYQGCGCQGSQYGCCLDGITPAKGPGYEGCMETVIPPNKPGEVCGLPEERGQCGNFTVKWFFDIKYGGCSRFWYGGCEGNDNRFETQEECEQVCVTPEGIDACHLPSVAGPCEDRKIYWYYNFTRQQCGQFYYGGCLGNNNRFRSEEECEQTCSKAEIQDPCLQPKVEGPCHGEFLRWYYNKETGTCSQFRYGGCKGNQNNFENERACVQKCVSTSEQEICSLPKTEGPCTDQLPRWYFDTSLQQCLQFHYGGCEGNANRFESETECQRVCAGLQVTDICELPKDSGPCLSGNEERWYYDKDTKRCHIFIHSGCGGNGNNFESQEDCENRCSTPVVDTEDFSLEDCHVEKSYGKCTDNIVNWYYDKSDGVCKQFYYSGCNGNKNRFATRQECEKRCFSSQDICQLPKVLGPCSGQFHQWYYNKAEDVCEEFYFGGCEGNGNRFDTQLECEAQCKITTVPPPPPPSPKPRDPCILPKDPGPCQSSVTNWYYNYETAACEQFSYGGCEGNINRFASQESCERACGQFKSQDVCDMQQDPGPCLGSFQKWYHDPTENLCKSFIYGGCHGNGNRFSSKKECEQVCIARKFHGSENETVIPSEICMFPADPGPCTEAHSRWFYDSSRASCFPFTYGGCGGNKNRFKTSETCLGFCSAPSCPDPIDCNSLNCPYGIDEYTDRMSGCLQCKCANPCEGISCPEGQACVIESTSSVQDLNYGKPVCRRTETPSTSPPQPIEQTEAAGIRPMEPEIRILANKSISISCVSYGNPKPIISWKKDDRPLAIDNIHYHILENGSLYIPYASIDYAGTYTCTAENGIGKPAENSVRLIVEEPARILPGPRLVVVIINAPCMLDCNAIGNPRPVITWWKEKAMLPRISEKYEQLTNYSMLIRKVEIPDLGNYFCLAYNGVGDPARWDILVQTDDHAFRNPKPPNEFLLPEYEPPKTESRSLQAEHNSDTQLSHLNGLSNYKDDSQENSPSPFSSEFDENESTEQSHFSDNLDNYIDNTQAEQPLKNAYNKSKHSHSTAFKLIAKKKENNAKIKKGFHSNTIHFEELEIHDNKKFDSQDISGKNYHSTDKLSNSPHVDPKSVKTLPEGYYYPDDEIKHLSLNQYNDHPLIKEENVDLSEFYVSSPHDTFQTTNNQTEDGLTSISSTETTITPLEHQSTTVIDYSKVLVTTKITLTNTNFALDSNIRIDCETEGSLQILWYKDGILLQPDSRTQLMDNGTLVIYNAAPSDAATYRCEASNTHNVASSSVTINVDGFVLHPNCTDNPYFANCKLIVKAKYCINKYYARFCCKSCTLAGQLDVHGLHLP